MAAKGCWVLAQLALLVCTLRLHHTAMDRQQTAFGRSCWWPWKTVAAVWHECCCSAGSGSAGQGSTILRSTPNSCVGSQTPCQLTGLTTHCRCCKHTSWMSAAGSTALAEGGRIAASSCKAHGTTSNTGWSGSMNLDRVTATICLLFHSGAGQASAPAHKETCAQMQLRNQNACKQ